jgi:hypothetical protein
VTGRRALIAIALASCLLGSGCGGEATRERDPDRVTILFAGDTSYGENYQVREARRGGVNILEAEGYDHSFAGLLPLLRDADLVVANLETPITSLRRSPLAGGKRIIHWSHIEKAPAGLRRHNIGVVSLANNHAMDFGAAGLTETLRALAREGIETFGAGRNEEAAKEPWRRDFHLGGRVWPLRVIGAFAYSRLYRDKFSFYARGERPGVHALTESEILAQVQALKRAEPEAFLVVFPHWGKNYVWRNAAQERLAHRLVDAGADLVLGHGAHMLQEIELYRDRWIAYGIGNFMFNSHGRFGELDVPPFGLPVRLIVEQVDGRVEKTLRFYPIFSDNPRTRYQPRMVTRSEFDRVWRLLEERSRDPEAFAREAGRGKDGAGHYLEVRLR